VTTALPFIAFGFFAAVIWVQQRRGTRRRGAKFTDLPARARWFAIAAWALGLIAIAGSGAGRGFTALFIPAGALLLATAWDLRDVPMPDVNPAVLRAALGFIGIVWLAIGVVALAA
jgi:hypothetical protein